MPDPTPQQLEALRFIARWCHANHVVPPEIHDAAAFALDQPSLAHGFYTPPRNKTHNQPAKDVAED